MVRNRKGLAPWSLAREAGIESATVDGTIEVPQYVQPTLSTGFVDEKGDWKGEKSNDKDFIAFHTDEAIANGANFTTPDVNSDGTWPLDMTGFRAIFMALKPTNGGNCAISAIMGPDALSFANLRPVNAAAPLKGNYPGISSNIEELLNDSAESLTADVWNIFYFNNMLENQKLLQFKVVNNSGGISTIETAFMRIV
jgi:hypothetical protein